MTKKLDNKGVALLEMLLAVSLLGVVSVALLSTLRLAWRVDRQVQENLGVVTALARSTQRLQQDLLDGDAILETPAQADGRRSLFVLVSSRDRPGAGPHVVHWRVEPSGQLRREVLNGSASLPSDGSETPIRGGFRVVTESIGASSDSEEEREVPRGVGTRRRAMRVQFVHELSVSSDTTRPPIPALDVWLPHKLPVVDLDGITP